jgi:amidase
MAKTVYDIAVVLDSISGNDASNSYTSYLSGTWADISVAVLDPTEWKYPDSILRPVPEATVQIVSLREMTTPNP